MRQRSSVRGAVLKKFLAAIWEGMWPRAIYLIINAVMLVFIFHFAKADAEAKLIILGAIILTEIDIVRRKLK